MQGTAKPESADRGAALFGRIRDILLSARVDTARSVNSAQVLCNWLVGREIVEEEQRGRRRADYSQRLLDRLAARLRAEFGNGYSATSLRDYRKFYLIFPRLVTPEAIQHPVGAEFPHISMPTTM
jgi:hypothetical protein